ncbi:hypothetical protein JCM24511_02300 [Saitozyma sp. JCM 24511]|nr:hypothetical protein JCM24511_02300 [Saitozyma sp. JCM 24511]
MRWDDLLATVTVGIDGSKLMSGGMIRSLPRRDPLQQWPNDNDKSFQLESRSSTSNLLFLLHLDPQSGSSSISSMSGMTILRGSLPRAASLASRHVPHASLVPVPGVLGRYLPTPHAGPSRLPPSLRSRSATTLSSASPSSVSPSLAPPIPPTRHSIKITTPSLESIKQEGFFDDDVALVPPEKAKLIITPEAVEQLTRISAREPPDVRDKLALRVGVEGGGCHGYQYTMALTEEKGVDDYVFQPEGEGVDCIPVIVDLVSLGLVKGSTLHHATELIGSSFRIDHNPQAKQGGSCGCGVSWEAVEA